MAKRKTKEDYRGLAESRGFKWVGEVLPKNVLTKTRWECRTCGNRWVAIYSSIQQNKGCPVCAKKSEADYKTIGKDKNITWASSILPKTTHHKTWWKCVRGHLWKTSYSVIKSGSGCPHCNMERQRHTVQDYHVVGQSRRIKWVDKDLPKNTNTKTWWECEKGHRWQAIYSNIYQGSGCPICKDLVNGVSVSKQQRKLNDLLCGTLNCMEGKKCIDVAIIRNNQKIAVEYDSYYWHQGKEEYDADRDIYLISRGWKIIHIKSNRLIPTRKQLKHKISSVLSGKDIVNLYLEDWG